MLSSPEHGEPGGFARIQRGFRWALAAWALLDSWMCRFQMSPDGVSYPGHGGSVLERELAWRTEPPMVAALWLAYGVAVSSDQAVDALGVSGSASAQSRDLFGDAVLF